MFSFSLINPFWFVKISLLINLFWYRWMIESNSITLYLNLDLWSKPLLLKADANIKQNHEIGTNTFQDIHSTSWVGFEYFVYQACRKGTGMEIRKAMNVHIHQGRLRTIGGMKEMKRKSQGTEVIKNYCRVQDSYSKHLKIRSPLIP